MKDPKHDGWIVDDGIEDWWLMASRCIPESKPTNLTPPLLKLTSVFLDTETVENNRCNFPRRRFSIMPLPLFRPLRISQFYSSKLVLWDSVLGLVSSSDSWAIMCS